jgi:hypothetical protein
LFIKLNPAIILPFETDWLIKITKENLNVPQDLKRENNTKCSGNTLFFPVYKKVPWKETSD